MSAIDAVTRGRGSYGRRAWRDAYEALSVADEHASLEAADLDRLAMAAYLIGRDQAAVRDLGAAAASSSVAGDLPGRAPARRR